MRNPYAFPSPGVVIADLQTGHPFQQGACDGMTLRDYFAAKAMQALLTDSASMARASQAAKQTLAETVAIGAFKIADAMLEERK